jgi:5-methyltetrahydropteroyltriglutamate--homocysteine methyltransferase
VDVGLLTTTIGSLPKPATVKRARWQFAEGEIERAELTAMEEQATAAAVRLQQDLGIDLPTDGQMDRGDLVADYSEHLSGLEPAGLVRCWGNHYYRRPSIVGPVSRPAAFSVAAWKQASRHANRPLKAVLMGPYTLMDWSYDEHYGSREAACLALAAALAEEAAELVAAGVTELQLDEPAVGSRPDELALVAEAVGRVTASLGAGVRSWLHVCYGDLRPVIGEVLALPVDGLLLEMANSRFELADALGQLPEGKLLGVGVVDAISPEIESVDAIRSRVERLLQQVPRESLLLCPDAGLRTLSAEQAAAKLRVMVEAAAGL